LTAPSSFQETLVENEAPTPSFDGTLAPDFGEQQNTFTLTITDNGEEFDVQWSIDPPWDGESAPPPSYYVGGLVVNHLKELLEEPDEGPTLVE
jgi:hypothetical protein